MKLTADIMIADKPNGNGRIYPRAALEACVKRWEAKRPLLGVIEVDRGPLIAMDEASHVIEKLSVQGDTLVADIKVLDTVEGRRLQQLLAGATVTFRSSGFGKVAEDGKTILDYELISINATIDGTEL